MEAYSGCLIALWLFPLWLLGWLALPLSRRVFLHLPDGGLAAGRVLALTLMSLAAFWGASLHLVSLRATPLLIFGAPLVVGLTALCRLAVHASLRREFSDWLRRNLGAVLTSDAVFLLAFLFFVWIRLCRPEINDFEKPMDSAIIGSLSRSTFLPAENPWFAGDKFTNYYYFGHFMGSLLKRSFSTPLPYAYNLIQPAFCAFFISTLWSLCAALSGAAWRGTIATIMIALCGHFEPLRQWLADGASGFNKSEGFPFLDWWSTSRVIPNTINEYPAFTLIIGDAHAHFFALSLAVLLFCACWELVARASSASTPDMGTHLKSLGLVPVTLGGFLLGAILMTNSWDFPLYGLLTFLSAIIFGSRLKHKSVINSIAQPIFFASWPLIVAVMTACPFLLRFKSPAGGITGEFWIPPVSSFLLFWGGFLMLWIVVLVLPVRDQYADGTSSEDDHQRFRTAALVTALLFIISILWPALLLLSLILLLVITGLRLFPLCSGRVYHDLAFNKQSQAFLYLLAGIGLIAILAPMVFYLRGYFGGDLRHQDTIFKFGLQGWLLLGTASACRWVSSSPVLPAKDQALLTSRATPIMGLIVSLISCAAWMVPLLCSYSVFKARVQLSHSMGGDKEYSGLVSLNGARHLSLSEQRALLWLDKHAVEGATVIEPVGRQEDGQFAMAYSEYGRVSALTGVSAYIGWPQHAGFWGAHPLEINQRLLQVEAIYHSADLLEASQRFASLSDHTGTRYLFMEISDHDLSLWNHSAESRSLPTFNHRLMEKRQSSSLKPVYATESVKIFAIP